MTLLCELLESRLCLSTTAPVGLDLKTKVIAELAALKQGEQSLVARATSDIAKAKATPMDIGCTRSVAAKSKQLLASIHTMIAADQSAAKQLAVGYRMLAKNPTDAADAQALRDDLDTATDDTSTDRTMAASTASLLMSPQATPAAQPSGPGAYACPFGNTYTWASRRNGNFLTPSNWNPVGNPGVNDFVLVNGPSGIVMTMPYPGPTPLPLPICGGEFNAPATLVLNGSGVAFENAYSEATTGTAVNVEGSGVFSVAGDVTDVPGTSLNIDGNSSTVAEIYSDLGSVSNFAVNVTVDGGVLELYTNQHLASLTIENGGTVIMEDGDEPDLLHIADGLSIDSSSHLDLDDNSMILDPSAATPTLPTVQTWVASGYANGTFEGTTGITSSTAQGNPLLAVGAIQNNQNGSPIYSSYDGEAVGANSIIVATTYVGDANLDGKVDGSDYSLIDNGYLQHLNGWLNGDFNYDGLVNGSDYTLIDNAFNTQGPPIDTTSQRPTFQETDFSDSNWTMINQSIGSGGSATAEQVSSGGDPGAYRQTTITVNTNSGYTYSAALIAHLDGQAIYNPATQGAIGSVAMSLDALLGAGGFGNGIGEGIALEQNGVVYYSANSQGLGLFTTPDFVWTLHTLSGLVASDFYTSDNWLNETSGSGQPDFSATAAPITFGYYTDSVTAGGGYTMTGGVDNWMLTVKPSS